MTIRRHPLALTESGCTFPLDTDLAGRLEASAALCGPPAGALTTRFYERLFERAPQLRPMFPDDLSGQRDKFGAMLDFVIKHLQRPDELTRPLKELGDRHRGYGVRTEHYSLVVEELVGAMADVAGPAWTREDAADWALALRIVCERMLGV